MWVARLLLTLIIVAIIIGFAVYNSGESVTVRVLGHTYESVPMIIVAFWAFIVGMVVSFVLALTYNARMQRQLAEQKRENKKLILELTSLRNVAIEEIEE
jgi:uncharacterized integral membrane protein